MNPKMKKSMGGILVILLIVIAAFWLFGDNLEHIEDTNGPDNYALTTITDQQIIDRSLGGMNVKSKTGLTGMVKFSSNQFTGVYEILSTNYVLPSDLVLTLYDFAVTSGNFKMCVVNEGKIVGVIEPGEHVDYLLEDVSGAVSLIIAGESAEFCFEMTETDYDGFSHS